jgi:hypothetical protein
MIGFHHPLPRIRAILHYIINNLQQDNSSKLMLQILRLTTSNAFNMISHQLSTHIMTVRKISSR